jgi:hypothetical protein
MRQNSATHSAATGRGPYPGDTHSHTRAHTHTHTRARTHVHITAEPCTHSPAAVQAEARSRVWARTHRLNPKLQTLNPKHPTLNPQPQHKSKSTRKGGDINHAVVCLLAAHTCALVACVTRAGTQHLTGSPLLLLTHAPTHSPAHAITHAHPLMLSHWHRRSLYFRLSVSQTHSRTHTP